MLFDSSIRKELARAFGATLVVLITVVMTMMLIRTLGLAARGNVAPTDVLLVMGYTVLGQLSTILSLSLFVAVVSVLSRMYRDSEMVIWFSAGRGLASLLAPLLRFAWPVMLAVGALALVAWPWANRQIQDLRTRYEQRADVDRIAPGQFQESANGTRVFFIDKETPDASSASNVFIATTDADRETVTSAQGARLQIIEGERVAVLSHGQRLETLLRQPGLRLSEFAEYGTRIGKASAGSAEETQAKARSTLELAAAAPAGVPRRAGLAAGAGGGRAQFRRAGGGAGGGQPARRAQRQHAAGAVHLRRLLQPDGGGAKLDRQRPRRPGRLHGSAARRHAGAGAGAAGAAPQPMVAARPAGAALPGHENPAPLHLPRGRHQRRPGHAGLPGAVLLL